MKMCKGYLDNAATSRFKPRAVRKAVIEELCASANPGRSGHRYSIGAGETVEACRAQISALTGMPKAVFTKNCTEALNLALFGLNLKGEVVTTVFEHNSILRPLKRLEAEGKISLRIVRPERPAVTAKDLVPFLNKRVCLLAMAEQSNLTGARHHIEDIAAAAKSRGIPVLLDAAQSLGHTDADYKDVDFLACSGHKGLHGPQGTGFLAYRDKVLTPLLYGGTGSDSYMLTQPASYPEGLESGTQNTLGIAGLAAGIRWTIKHKTKIQNLMSILTARLLEGLKTLDGIRVLYEQGNGVAAFNIKNLPSGEVANILDTDYRIAVRSGLHCAPLAHRYFGTDKQGAVRASMGWGNTADDIDNLLYALKGILLNNRQQV